MSKGKAPYWGEHLAAVGCLSLGIAGALVAVFLAVSVVKIVIDAAWG